MTGPRNKALSDGARQAEIKARWQAGQTLQAIGDSLGLSRECIRQLLRKEGVDPKSGGYILLAPDREKLRAERAKRRLADLDRKSLAQWGFVRDQMRLWRDAGLIDQYRMQRGNARERGIPWDFSFSSWMGVWLASGKLSMRGRYAGMYVMSRFGDEGPYSPGNVQIKTCSENIQEYQDRKRAQK